MKQFNFVKGLAAVLALTTALGGQIVPAMAEDAEAAVTEILPYQDGNSDYSGWVPGGLKQFAPQDGALYADTSEAGGNKRSRVDIPAEVQALYADGATTPYRLVMLSRIKLEAVVGQTAYAEFDFENGSNSATMRIMGLKGDGSTGKVIPIYRSNSNAATSTPIGELEESVEGWADCAAVINGVGKTAKMEFYVNGKRVQREQDGVLADFTYDIPELKAERFRIFINNKGKAYFDDIHAYAVAGGTDAVLPLTASELPTSIGTNGSMTVNFNQELILGETDGLVYINNEAVSADRVSVSADRKSITIASPFDGYDYGAELNIAISGLKGYAGGAMDYSAAVSVEEAPEIVYGRRVEYLPYQDFTEGYTGPDWVNNSANVRLSVKNGVLAGAPEGSGNQFLAIDYPADFIKAWQNGEDAYLVIKSKMAMLSAGASNPFVEIGLGKRGSTNNASSVVKRLARIRAIGSAPQFFINTKNATDTDSAKICNVGFGEEVDVAIVIHVADDGTETVTYYKNGALLSKDNPIELGESEYVRLIAQNECSVYFDDVEFYAIVGGAAQYTCSGISGAASDVNELDANDSILLSFTSDCITENLFSGGVSAFKINGEAVETDRVSISADGRSVVIAAPEGGYAPQTKYEVTIASWLKDIFGTPISDVPVNLSFTTGGKFLEAVILSSQRDENTAEVTVKLYNANSEAKSAWVIMTEGTDENGDYMMQQVQLEKVELGANSSKEIVQTLTLEHNGIAQVYVWEADVMDPILDMPLQLTNN